MGLDMYLTKRTHVQNWSYMPEDQRHTVTVTGPAAAHILPERISEIVEQVAYWRKANAIHRYFVETCQEGVDDCREAYVSLETLADLVDRCRKILAVAREATDAQAWTAVAQDLLPPQSGFFFGSAELDDFYLDDLRKTVDMVGLLLAEESGTYYYRSSW